MSTIWSHFGMQTTVSVPTPSTFFAGAGAGGAGVAWRAFVAAGGVAVEAPACVPVAEGVDACVATGGAVGEALAVTDGGAALPFVLGTAGTAVLKADRAAVNGPAATPAVVRGEPAPCWD